MLAQRFCLPCSVTQTRFLEDLNSGCRDFGCRAGIASSCAGETMRLLRSFLFRAQAREKDACAPRNRGGRRSRPVPRPLCGRGTQAGTYVPVRLAGRGGWRCAPPDRCAAAPRSGAPGSLPRAGRVRGLRPRTQAADANASASFCMSEIRQTVIPYTIDRFTSQSKRIAAASH